jgi:DNA gyrase subunit A
MPSLAYIDNIEIDIDSLVHIIKAPDFPTGGTIYGYQGVKDAYATGRGRMVIRAKSDVETEKNGSRKNCYFMKYHTWSTKQS